MIEEIHLFGLYLPTALATAIAAALITWPVSSLMRHRTWGQRWLWQPGLLDLALFAGLWWGLALAADRLLPPGTVA